MKFSIFENGGDLEGSVSINGLTMTGKLKLLREATEPNEAVNKQFVDNAVGNLDASKILSGTMPVDRFPGLSGDFVSVAGSGVISLKNTGVIPGNYTKVTVNNSGLVISGGNLTENDIPNLGWEKITEGKPTTLAGYGITDAVNRNNGTVNGNVTLAHDPIDDDDVVTKAYADNALANREGFGVGDIVMNAGITTPVGFLRCNGGEVSKVLYPELYNILLNSANTVKEMEYTSHSAMGAGQPWRQQYDFNNSQSTDITGWTTGTPLPGTSQYPQAIVTKNRVYLLGGYNSPNAVSTVYTAPINEDGTLGAWTTGTPLPGRLYGSQAIVTKNRVYLLGGGSDNTNAVSTVYTAPINADGTLGTWTTGTPLPGILTYSQAIVTKNRVYLLGGGDPGRVSTVYTAPINEDGTLGTWTTGTSLPVTLAYSQAIVTKNRVYLLGGVTTSVHTPITYTAPINEDGTLGAWTDSGNNLPGVLSYSQSIVTKNRVYLLGGYNGGYSNSVYTAPINEDGTIGTWTTGTTLPRTLGHSQAIVTKNRVYLLGGNGSSTVYTAPLPGSESLNDYSNFYNGTINKFDGTSLSGKVVLKQGTSLYDRYTQPGAGKPWKQQYEINTSQSTNITGWVSAASLPGALGYSQAIVTKNRVYLLGGQGGSTSVSTVYTAPINEDGTLGTWTNSGNNLPVILSHSQAIVTKNRVYLLGGHISSPTSTVYTAPINEDGTLGTWTTGTSLPGGLTSSQAIVTKNRVYLLGGHNGSSFVSTVRTAPINEDGTLGVWTNSGNNLPGTLGYSQAIVTKNRVYLLGGWSGNGSVSTVYTAPINEDGTLGTWTTGTSLPGALGYSQAIVTKNRVYLLGAPGSSTVYTAPINEDGTLGTWTTGTSLPVSVHASQAIVTKNRVYLLGAPSSSTVYTAPFSGGYNDYSSYYDGTIDVNDTDIFRLPDYSHLEDPSSAYVIKH